jgi:hypothetical protein
MQDKQKVTLYIQPELHRKLKIRAAVDSEPMSSIAERAILFYLENPEVVDEAGTYGQTHRVYSCPECTSSVVMREGELVSLKDQPKILADQDIPVERSPESEEKSKAQPGEQELVPC